MNDQTKEAVGIPTGRKIRNPGYNRLTGRGKHSQDVSIKILRSVRGNVQRVADALSLTASSVGLWRRVPLEYVFDVARIINTDPAALRPDFFIKDPLRAPRARGYLDAGMDGRPAPLIGCEEHRAIWFNTANYPTNAMAAAAIGESLGFSVSTDQLRRLFGKSGRVVGYFRIQPGSNIGSAP